MSTNKVWWGEFSFAQQEQKCWRIGDRAIVIKHQNNEWNSWNLETHEENDNNIIVSDCLEFTIADTVEMGRFLERNTSYTIKVTPQLADKTFVARPSSPLTILAGETVQLFISTPIWFYAETSPGGQCLLDLPFWRPSDSWFGASTIDGQLCYAKYTSAKTRHEELKIRPHRATTTITVKNSHHKPFTINRINVPVNYLHLYSDDNNQFWTSAISIERENESNDVELVIDDNSSHQTKSYNLVNTPRLAAEHGKLIRNISNLFG